jgi:protein O-mannosyl-transferase
VPFFIVAVTSGLLTSWVERNLAGAKGAAFELALLERCLLAGRAFWFYLGKLFWPVDLLFVYPHWQVNFRDWTQYLFPLAALVLLATAWRLRLRWRGPLAGLLFFAGTLFPMLGFFNIYLFYYTYVADHFQYLASLGMIALVSAGMALTLRRYGQWRWPWGYGACMLLLATLGCITWRQSRMYTDIETLYQTTFEKNPNSWMVSNNLGTFSMRRGELGKAISYFRQSLDVKPDFAEAHYNLGLAFANQKRFDAAMVEYRKALENKPDNPMYRNNLGTALSACGRIEEAIVEFQTILKKHPNFALAHSNISVALADQDQFEEAIFHCASAMEIQPDNAETPNNLGEALTGRGQFSAAMALFQEALKIKPDHARARENLMRASQMLERAQKTLNQRREQIRLHSKDKALLNDTAWILATHPDASLRNGVEAVGLAQRAVELSDGKEPAILGTLAAAYAEVGQFAKAVQTAEKAIALATEQNKQTLSDSIKARVQLYKANKPFYVKLKFITPN